MMEFKRIRSIQELIEIEKPIMGLFKKYLERVKVGIDEKQMFINYGKHVQFPDCMFYVIIDNGIVGFIGCRVMRCSNLSFLLVDDIYCPKGGLKLWNIVKSIANTIGVDEIWGEAEESIYRTYRRVLKNVAAVNKQQFVRLMP
jgi:hypothetical protein